MSRKNAKKTREQDGLNNNKDTSSPALVPLILGILAVVAVLAVVVFFAMPSIKGTVNEARIPGQLVETRDVLPWTQFSGQTAEAYKSAAEKPEVIDRQFCYCYCKKNLKHKTLLTCFTDGHAAKCGICQKEALRSYELAQKGMPMEEIKKAIEKEFGKHGNS